MFNFAKFNYIKFFICASLLYNCKKNIDDNYYVPDIISPQKNYTTVNKQEAGQYYDENIYKRFQKAKNNKANINYNLKSLQKENFTNSLNSSGNRKVSYVTEKNYLQQNNFQAKKNTEQVSMPLSANLNANNLKYTLSKNNTTPNVQLTSNQTNIVNPEIIEENKKIDNNPPNLINEVCYKCNQNYIVKNPNSKIEKNILPEEEKPNTLTNNENQKNTKKINYLSNPQIYQPYNNDYQNIQQNVDITPNINVVPEHNQLINNQNIVGPNNALGIYENNIPKYNNIKQVQPPEVNYQGVNNNILENNHFVNQNINANQPFVQEKNYDADVNNQYKNILQNNIPQFNENIQNINENNAHSFNINPNNIPFDKDLNNGIQHNEINKNLEFNILNARSWEKNNNYHKNIYNNNDVKNNLEVPNNNTQENNTPQNKNRESIFSINEKNGNIEIYDSEKELYDEYDKQKFKGFKGMLKKQKRKYNIHKWKKKKKKTKKEEKKQRKHDKDLMKYREYRRDMKFEKKREAELKKKKKNIFFNKKKNSNMEKPKKRNSYTEDFVEV